MSQPSDALFHAIADPNRRRIMDLLADGERTAGDVAAAFEISRPGVAKHLKILESAGLVEVRKVGRNRINRFRPEALEPVRDWIARYDRFWTGRLATLERRIEEDQ